MKKKRRLNGFYLSTMSIFLLFILAFMALPVIPTLRITTRGIIDVVTQQYI